MAKLLSGTRIYGTATVDTNLFVNSTANSTSSATGALQVAGGIGLAGSLYAAGNSIFADNLSINGGSLNTTAATFNLLNTTATTVNAFGAATNITLGASSGTTTVNNNLTVIGLTQVNGGLTLSGSPTQGSESFSVTDGTTPTFTIDTATGSTVISGSLTVIGSAEIGDVTFTSGNFTGQIISSVVTGTAPLVIVSTTKVDNLNVDLLDGYHADENNIANTVVVRTVNGRVKISSVELSGNSGTTVLQTETSASGILTLPATTDTLLGKNTTDTLTNKSVDLATNTLTGTLAQFNTALSDADFVSLAGTETLTNKTLTNPTLNVGTGILVLPQALAPVQTDSGSVVWDSDDNLLTIGTGTGRKTLVDLDSSQTLTNKTLTSPVITNVSPTITLAGDLSGAATLTDLGSVTLTATIEPNSVELGTDTTGNYVATIVGTTNQITVTGSGTETAAITLSLPQDINTAATPAFAGATLSNVQIGIAGSNEIDTVSGNLTIDSAGGTVTVDDNLIISGNLTVQGTTVTVNSTVISIVDPIVDIGGAANGGQLTSNDGKDRGIKFNWYNGASRNGFFGYDASTGYFTFIPEATFTNEVVSGTPGQIEAATFRGNLIADTVTISEGLLAIGDVTFTPNVGKTFTINPTDVGAINNVNIGSAVRGTGAFTTLTSNGLTTITDTTQSVNKDTGAFVVEGGAGIEKNVNIGGDLAVDGTLSVGGSILFGGALTVPNGGTGTTSFTSKGIVYGNGINTLLSTLASVPGENATTSFGILTTDDENVPIWTDVIDAGSFDNSVVNGSVSESAIFDIAGSDSTTSGVSPAIIESFDINVYSAVKYIVVVKNPLTNSRQTSEILATHNNVIVEYIEYAILFTGASKLADISVQLVSNEVRLISTPLSSSNLEYKVVKTLII